MLERKFIFPPILYLSVKNIFFFYKTHIKENNPQKTSRASAWKSYIVVCVSHLVCKAVWWLKNVETDTFMRGRTQLIDITTLAHRTIAPLICSCKAISWLSPWASHKRIKELAGLVLICKQWTAFVPVVLCLCTRYVIGSRSAWIPTTRSHRLSPLYTCSQI